MGVKGLSTYVRACPAAFSQQLDLRGKALAVDGVALCYQIMLVHGHDAPCLCLNLGCDYRAFSGAVHCCKSSSLIKTSINKLHQLSLLACLHWH
jgi:hypothetical protein